MGNYDSGKASVIGGLNIKLQRADSLNGIRFDSNRSVLPSSSSDFVLFRHGNSLKVWDGTSTTTIGGAGAAATPSWESLFAGDTTFNVAGTTWTIDNSTGNNDVLTVTNTGAGSGDCIQITNAGTGYDIRGDSNTWAVAKTGIATLAGWSVTGTTTALATTGAATWTLLDNSATALSIGASGDTNIMVISTDNTTPEVIFNDNLRVVAGLATFISTSNTVQNVLVTNNTITTYGVTQAASAGMMVLRSTSLTTGTMLRLQASNTAMTTGFYLECMDSDGGGTTEFSVGENGATVITGSAAGTTAFTITTGDAVISSGSLAITRAGDAVNLTVTNNTATTASVVAITGSGIHTGTTTTSFMTLTQSGTTAGTVLYIVAAAAATSVAVVDLVTLGLTSGTAFRVASTTAVFTTGGKLIELTSAAAVAGNHLTATTTGAYTGTGMILVTAGAATTGVLISAISTTGLTSGSLIRATTSTAGALATNGAISFTATGAFTSTSAVDGGFVEVKANSTTAGTIVNVVGSGLTTGIGLQLSNGTSGMTSGSMIRVTASGTGTIATNGIVSITHAGIYLSTSNVGLLDVAATALVGAGTVVHFSSTAASQTAAQILNVTQSGATLTAYTGTIASFVGGFSGSSSTGTIIGITAVSTTAGDALKITNNALTLGSGTLANLSHTTSVIGAGSSMLRITSTGVDTGTTTGTLIDLASTAATSAVLMLVTSATLDSGKALLMNLNGLTTGAGIHVAHTTAVIASGGSLLRLSSTSIDTGTTTGNLLDLSSTASTAGTQVLMTFSGLTTGLAMNIVGANVNSGTLLRLTATEANLTSGLYFNCYDGAASDFSIARYGATVIAGNAALTASLTLTKGDLVMSDGVFTVGTSATITADAGSAQGGGAITRSYVEIAVCGVAGDSVTLPAAVAGRVVIITNHGANAADVFPASGDAINEGAADTATSIAVNETFLCIAYDTTNWEVVQLARNS